MVLSVGQISVGPWNYKSNSSAEDEAWILRLNFLVEYQSSNDDKKQIVIDSLVYMADATEPGKLASVLYLLRRSMTLI